MRTRRELAQLIANVPLVLGALGIAAIAAIALFGPELAPADPQAQQVVIFFPDHFAVPPTPPDRFYPLGTDELGRDQLSRLLWGARLTLTAVLLGLVGRGAFGIALGLVAGWRRDSWVDRAIGYLTNAIAAMPQLMLALLVVVALQGAGAPGFIFALALVGWAELAQFVRAEVIRVAAAPHIAAARAIGGTSAHLIRAHVLRDLAPQLFGILALEAGSVLLLLAELGFIGFFISGGTFYVDDSGRPILPIRDRAPEWGQMLAGARKYAFQHQYVAFVPGAVVASSVLAFSLFAEGLRAASDPFGRYRLSPRTLGSLARGFAAAALIAGTAFGYLTVRSTSVSFDDGLRIAKESAERVLPGSELVAGVVRFRSSSHALAQPEKLTYYFRSADATILRVSFVNADANALEVKLYSHEDDIVFEPLRPVGEWKVAWEQALSNAEEVGGRDFRNAAGAYVVRVILTQESDANTASYSVRYQRPLSAPEIDVRMDAVTGETGLDPERLVRDAEVRARQTLGTPVRLIAMSAGWRSRSSLGPPAQVGFDAETPASHAFTFARVEAPYSTITVFYGPGGNTGRGGFGTLSQPPRPIQPMDLEAAFAAVERAYGRGLREEWQRLSLRTWMANASVVVVDGRQLVAVNYLSMDAVAAGTGRFHQFRYDPRTGQVERLGP